ncbi:hypothetical protein EGW08_004317 [Elysia chlorotica]|uniref:Amidohydrolase-related domain-containing protein n=1 Tax=Elysia chlorotica TaxID=188477 RepID=A0A433U248_ELYCH|nr:hypothetical protein EGW08_004317 [Elysia chlorotica]
MSKMLHLGMPLIEVIRAVTSTPARAIGKDQEIGSLSVGRRADISILKLEDVTRDLEDSRGEVRTLTRAFRPVKVFVSGTEAPVTAGAEWANLDCVTACRERTAFVDAEEAKKKIGSA